tara:strand:- start:2012 stop:3826 length:1815 start_codon:yes stop_codon:yes gene_type:complete
MAALDSNVYKTPSFTALGLKKDKQVKDERDFRGREASATGAERAFGDAQYEVTGARKDVLQEAYNLYSGAATKYEKSGSDVDGKTMKDLASKVNFFAGAGMSMQGEWNKTYADAQANEFVGYSENPEQIQQRYNQRMYDNAEVKTENGKILIKEGDKFVPAEQSSFFSSQINPNNSFLLPKAIQTGKYAIPSAYAEEIKGVITSSQNAEQAIDKATSEFQHRLKSDASFRQDVGLHYYINDLNLIDGKQGVSRGDMRKVDERMLDEEFFGKAVESYLGNIQSSIKNSMSTSAIESNPSYIETIKDTDTEVEMFAIEKVGDIVGVGVAEDGKFYISKQITSGVPPQMVEATGAEIAQIERKLGVSVKGMNKQTESETPQQTQQPQQIQESEPEVEEVKQMLPKQEEVKGTEGDSLGLGFTPETGRAAPADTESNVASVESNVASVKISPNIDFNTDSVEKVMAHWTTDQGREKSEITPQMIIGVSNKYNIPVEVTMAMLATEGNFGTSERQVKTKNPFNWGNTTSGDDKSGKEQDKFNKYYDTWEEGIDAWGEGFSRLYRPESGNWSELWEKEFVRKDGKRYATDKNYEKTIASIVNKTIPKYAA